jgi:hypothetical protein
MILMCLCIIDFIGGNGLRGRVGVADPGRSWALKWHKRSECHLGPGVSRAPSPPLAQVIHSPYEIYNTQGHKNQWSIGSFM